LWRHFFIVTIKLPSDVLHPELIHAKQPFSGRKFTPLIEKASSKIAFFGQKWRNSFENGRLK